MMFSVVIPLYNKELSIRNTIQSVLDQTFQDFELIVINDGSTDNSAAVVESIGDKRIRLLHQKNKGVSRARNRGMEEARADWIAFLDADDLWRGGHLEEVSLMIQAFPNAKVFTTSFEYSDNRAMFRHPRRAQVSKVENYFKEAVKERLMCSSCVIVHKTCIDKVGGFSEKITHGEDLDFWARLAREYEVIKSTEITALYRVDAENRSVVAGNIHSYHVFNFNLNLIDNPDEREYYRNLIHSRMYDFLRAGCFTAFLKLKEAHPEISILEFVLFAMRHVTGRMTGCVTGLRGKTR